MHINKGQSSHIPILLKYFQITKGPVLELGAGLFSTPLLHWICAESGRALITYEHNKEWFEIARKFRGKNHLIRFVEDWNKVDLTEIPSKISKGYSKWGLVFIDHEGDRRMIDAIRLKFAAEYIVLHDTQDQLAYDYQKFQDNFKYRFNWNFTFPETSVVSNFHIL